MCCKAGWNLGVSSLPWRRGKGTVSRSKFILLVFRPSYLSTLSNRYWILLFQSGIPFWPLSFFLFQGLWSLQQASMLRKEARKLEERARKLETEGWRQMREAVVGSEVENLYGFLKGVASYPHPASSQPSIKKPCLSSSASITQSPLQESTGLEVSDPAGQATVSTSSAASPAPEADILAHMQPLRVQVGVQSAYTSAGLRVAKRACHPHGPPLVPM